jgi:glycosyltransferase involved in cell wall biosynthesis
MTVRYVVAGPTRHGVVRHALRLGASDPFLSRALVRVPSEVSGHEPPGLRDALPPGSTVFLHVTDRLFGTSPEEAAATVRALAAGSTLALSLHDVPQASEGKEWYQRRRDAYAEFASAATQLVVASEFEKALLAACVDDPEGAGAVMRKTTVVPLPLETAASRHPVPDGASAEIAVLGYLYPGKGVEDVIDAAATMAACGRVVSVVNYGAAAEGHEDLVGQLRDRARRAGVCFRVTGYLGDDELAVALAGAGVPVAPHRHISASGSVNSWIAAGRRPIVRRGGYSVEVADRLPGALVLADSLHDAITAAVDDPGSTRLDPATRVGPTWAQAAQIHADILRGLS